MPSESSQRAECVLLLPMVCCCWRERALSTSCPPPASLYNECTLLLSAVSHLWWLRFIDRCPYHRPRANKTGSIRNEHLLPPYCGERDVEIGEFAEKSFTIYAIAWFKTSVINGEIRYLLNLRLFKYMLVGKWE